LYCQLTDTIVPLIEYSRKPELRPAQQILRRIKDRDLYKLAGEMIIPSGRPLTKLTAADIITAGSSLKEEDIILHQFSLNYAMKDQNPVDNVHFFSSNVDDPFSIPKHEVSLLIPDQFQESSIRVFVRDKSKLHEAKETFSIWKHKNSLN